MVDKHISKSDCPLGLVLCGPSCYWEEDGKCRFPEKAYEEKPGEQPLIDLTVKTCEFQGDDFRCSRVWTCELPQKKTCQAIATEIVFLLLVQCRSIRALHSISETVNKLILMRKNLQIQN